jgi:hypothetical protein
MYKQKVNPFVILSSKCNINTNFVVEIWLGSVPEYVHM